MRGRILAGAVVMLLSSGTVSAQERQNVRQGLREAIIPSAAAKEQLYDGPFHFAPALRAGDYVFVSGVVAGAFGGEVLDREGFAASVRRAFQAIGATLEAADAGFDGVAHMRTFHVFDSEFTTISKVEQFEVVAEVKNEFIPEPFSSWTGVGTTALLPDRGIVEIEVVVYAPQGG